MVETLSEIQTNRFIAKAFRIAEGFFVGGARSGPGSGQRGRQRTPENIGPHQDKKDSEISF